MQFTDPKVREIAVVAMSQVGKSEAELNMIGYMIDQDPGSSLYIQPNLDDAKKFSKLRIAPMLRDSPRLRKKVSDIKARDSGNTVYQKNVSWWDADDSRVSKPCGFGNLHQPDMSLVTR